MLDIFIDSRINYLKYGMERLAREKGVDLASAYNEIEHVFKWKETAIEKALQLYAVNKAEAESAEKVKSAGTAARSLPGCFYVHGAYSKALGDTEGYRMPGGKNV